MAKVFVSYADEDVKDVQKLVDKFNIREVDVWFDKDEIKPGDDFVEKMKRGIEQSDVFIVCLSPAFQAKPPQSWVRNELKMAMLRERGEGRKRIIPIRLKKGGDVPEEIGTRAFADLSTPKKWRSNFPRIMEALEEIEAERDDALSRAEEDGQPTGEKAAGS